jgi:hypothetical protein
MAVEQTGTTEGPREAARRLAQATGRIERLLDGKRAW